MTRIAYSEGGNEVFVERLVPLPVINSTFQIQLGNVDGFELRNIAAENIAVGTSFEDLSDVGGTQVLPTEGNPEVWEVVSTSDEDKSGGSGSTGGFVESLADGWISRPNQIYTLNGTTPVTLSGTHFRPIGAIITSPDGGCNVGDIIFRVAGGGAERIKIRAAEGVSKSSLFSVPVGFTVFAQFIIAASGKNQDVSIRSRIQLNGGPLIIGGTIPTYQGSIAWPIVAPFTLPEKIDIRFEAKSTNENTSVISFLDLLIVSNDKIITPPTVVRNFM